MKKKKNKNKDLLDKQEIDIFIPKYKIGIEFQGEQHFFPVNFGGYSEEKCIKNFKYINSLDIKKQKICNAKGITLLYFSNTSDNIFLNEKVYHNYDDLVRVISEIIKEEEEKS